MTLLIYHVKLADVYNMQRDIQMNIKNATTSSHLNQVIQKKKKSETQRNKKKSKPEGSLHDNACNGLRGTRGEEMQLPTPFDAEPGGWVCVTRCFFKRKPQQANDSHPR
jgi:hypothetical protein